MKHLNRISKTAFAVIFALSLTLIPSLAKVYATPPDGISTVTTKTAVPSQPVAITDLQITGSINDNVNVNIYAPTGSFSLGTSSNVTFTGSHTGNNLQIAGLRNDINTALATLTYAPSSFGSSQIQVRLGGGDGDVYNPANGHVYEVITPTNPISWQNAQTAAAASTYGGVNGYLATITSQQENDFVKARITSSGWIGGNDLATQDTWQWATGPEAGTTIWQGRSAGLGGASVGGQYANWYNNSSNLTTGSEPNNSGGNERCMELNVTENYQWNDLNCSSDPSYIVEYGAPGALPTTTQATFTVNATDDGDGSQTTVENNGPNSGDANNDGIQDSQQNTVTSVMNQLTSKYAVLQSTGCTAGNSGVSISNASSNSVNDTSYSYPMGLMSFTTNCATPGQTATITQYYYGSYNPTSYVMRKYNAVTHSYATIPAATLSSVTIGGQPALKVVYSITDGSSLDQDGTANGVIVDPAGPAILATTVTTSSSSNSANGGLTAPDTGLQPRSALTAYTSLISGSIALLLIIGFASRPKYGKKN